MSIKEMRIKKLKREESDIKRLGINVKYICLSVSCKYHHHLNGELFSFNEVCEIYQIDKIQNDCNCAITQILTNSLGDPLLPTFVEKIKLQKHDFN